MAAQPASPCRVPEYWAAVSRTIAPTPADEPEYADEHQVLRTTLVVYAAITLLGVIAAGSWKKFVTDEPELIVTTVGASIGVVIAHAWSSIMAHRLVHRSMMTRKQMLAELEVAASFFIVTGIAVAAIVTGQAFDWEFDDTVAFTEVVLIASLFTVGLFGSRASGARWGRSLAWGLLDAAVGVAIVATKLLLGG